MSDAFETPAVEAFPASAGLRPTAGEMPPASSPRRLLLTSDLRAATGLPRTHMDYYLREGIVRPAARSESGYLLFDESELETLRDVLRLRQAGVGIREIRDRIGRPAGS